MAFSLFAEVPNQWDTIPVLPKMQKGVVAKNNFRHAYFVTSTILVSNDL